MTIPQNATVARKHLAVTIFKKIARGFFRFPVTLVKKAARDMQKCP